MSLPPELRVLCFQLSNTPTSELPRLTPTLLHHIPRCRAALSAPVANTSVAASSASIAHVQVHQLKTQLSTLLNGQSPEGRFSAAVLIKAVVEAGEWEVLRTSEPWVRGLLSILGKQDSAASKELCIVALTKIYCMTHPYQTLVREITTPTLPAFITSCLNLLSSKSSKTQGVLTSTTEHVFRSFAMLLPRHTTIYRPFTAQIRTVTKPYLAPTASDGVFVPSSLAESARRLVVLLHQTAAKNAGGEEWARAVRELLKDIHVTADRVFRAVIEDWEPATGYVGENVDVSAELSGGAKDVEDLPRWTGINAGVERVVGLLQLLMEYLKAETSLPVSLPVGGVVDMITRMLSISMPSSQSTSLPGSMRLNPAIDRDERDGLWAGMPQIYVAALQVITTMAERLQESFKPLAQGFLDQLCWVFQHGKHDSDFRLHAYRLTMQLLLQIGISLSKSSSSKCCVIIRSCCNDLIPVNPKSINSGTDVDTVKANGKTSSTNQNPDLFLRNSTESCQERSLSDTGLIVAARALLPLCLSHFPQQQMDISLRSLIERTAILSHNKDAMLASILNPFIGKTGRATTSILPHLAREFSRNQSVEILLRPRMPLLPAVGGANLFNEEGATLQDGNEDMEMDADPINAVHETRGNTYGVSQSSSQGNVSAIRKDLTNTEGLGNSMLFQTNALQSGKFGTVSSSLERVANQHPDFHYRGNLLPQHSVEIEIPTLPEKIVDGTMTEILSDSDGESVHLTMQLDTESDSEG